ncbi:MAG TPA: PxKF domain-containing protein, partial [Gaiellaceae bacterium]
VAHGVVVDTLTSADLTPFDPDNVRPTVDLTANEPEPQFTDEAWPSKVPTLVTLDDTNGLRQNVNLATGQFFVDSASRQGVERKWTHIGGRVTYSASSDFVPPTIDAISSFISNGTVTFSGRFADLTETGGPGTVTFAQVVYDADNAGTWRALQLQHDANSDLWSGGATFGGTQVQFFVEVCDASGNCGYSSNKGRYFDAQPLPTPTGTKVTITPSRDPDTGTWYRGPLSVTVAGDAATVSVDGDPFAPATGPLTLAGDGAHIVEGRSADGGDATRVFLVDALAPAITHTIAPAAPDGTNGWYKTAPSVTFACTDDVSGVAAGSCVVDGSSPQASQATLGESASPQTIAATAVDNAGNAAHDSVAGLKVDLTDPAVPAFTGIQAKIYGTADLPPQSAIGCTSSDAISGLQSCIVAGYSSALGMHTLTATATDNAGRTRTNTLTYTVGFVVGDVLQPIRTATNDQDNPLASDLMVHKINSTIPVKFQVYLDAAKTKLLTSPPAGSVARITFKKYDSSTDSTQPTTIVSATPDTGDAFRWTGATDYQYIYNLQTKGQTAGTYYVMLTLYASDGTVLAQSKKQYFVLRS